MKSSITPKKIILASQSPRRKMLLAGLDLDFDVEVREVDEVFPEEMNLHDVAQYLAELKAAAWEGDVPEDRMVITADTVVILGDEMLEKPRDRDEAIEMLTRLSGKTHTVMTGVCFLWSDGKKSFADSTKVTFSQLERDEIEYYIDHYQPYDKAGSYGAQDFIGYIAIEKLEGSYFNVMGLPVHRVWEELKGMG